MLTLIGKEYDYAEGELKLLTVKKNADDKCIQFPELETGYRVACAYNQYGLKGMAKLIVCDTLEDMNELISKCDKGGAHSIKWYTISDDSIRAKFPGRLPFFQHKPKSFASMFEETFKEDERRGLYQ